MNDRENRRLLNGHVKLIKEGSSHRGQHHCLEKHKLNQLQGTDPILSPRTVKMLCQHLHYCCHCWTGDCGSWYGN